MAERQDDGWLNLTVPRGNERSFARASAKVPYFVQDYDDPQLIEQLRVWSVELADEADAVERGAAESDGTIISV